MIRHENLGACSIRQAYIARCGVEIDSGDECASAEDPVTCPDCLRQAAGSLVWDFPCRGYQTTPRLPVDGQPYAELRRLHPSFWRISIDGEEIISGPGSPGTLAGMVGEWP